MLALRGYLVLAALLLLIKAIQLGTHWTRQPGPHRGRRRHRTQDSPSI
jgi:hypothetical protein